MGEVWAATSDEMPEPDAPPGSVAHPRMVAIKVLLARAAMKPELVRRFEREAEIASAIKSPYVCQLVDVGRSDEGGHLIVFEQLTGESLADRLKREQYLPFSEVGPIIDDVLQGLAAAHAAGVIHRDLKPGNIFIERLDPAPPSDGAYAPPSGGFGFGAAIPQAEERLERAKILDFGISKLSRREPTGEPTLTAFDATLGSFAYMAPEQVRGAARADERADIYAVGAVAFRALSGRLPFEGATAAVLVAMKLDRQAPSLAEATGDQWPAGLERFLERALARRREHRFESAHEALDAWRSIQPARLTMATQGAPPEPSHEAAPAEPPPARAPMQSFPLVEDNPTEVDGPPTMTTDGLPPSSPTPSGHDIPPGPQPGSLGMGSQLRYPPNQEDPAGARRRSSAPPPNPARKPPSSPPSVRGSRENAKNKKTGRP